MPTDDQCLSEAKTSKSPTTLTPRPWCFIVKRVIKGITNLVVRFSDITKMLP